MPAIGVASLGAALVLALSPWLTQVFGPPSVATRPNGVVAAFLAAVSSIATPILRESHVEIGMVVVGAAAGMYVIPRRWWARAVAVGLGTALGVLLFRLGVMQTWVLSGPEARIPAAAWGVVGGLAATGIVNARKDRPAVLAWLGAAKALLWIPLALVVVFVGVYVGSAVFLLLLFAAILTFVFRLVVGGGTSRSASDGSEAAAAERARREEYDAAERANEDAAKRAAEEQEKAKAARTAALQGRAAGAHWDSDGRYAGKTDTEGRHWDSNGRYAGKTESDGRRYDEDGRYAGKSDTDGRRYDEDGRYAGKSDTDGRRYDEDGRYVGKKE